MKDCTSQFDDEENLECDILVNSNFGNVVFVGFNLFEAAIVVLT